MEANAWFNKRTRRNWEGTEKKAESKFEETKKSGTKQKRSWWIC